MFIRIAVKFLSALLVAVVLAKVAWAAPLETAATKSAVSATTIR